MHINNNQFEAILIIGQAEKYFSSIVEFFNQLDKQEIRNLLDDKQSDEPLLHIILLRAAMLSKHWSWDEILRDMSRKEFEEKSCHVLIDSKKLTGSQMIFLLQERVRSIGTVSIGPMVYAVIETEILTGQELLELLKLYSNLDLVELATPQLEKYINEELIMKVLLINDDNDPRSLAYYIGQLPDGHYATVETMLPSEKVPEKTRAMYIVLDFKDATESVALANRLAAKFREIIIILIDNENVQQECPHNLIIVSRIAQAAEYIFNNA